MTRVPILHFSKVINKNDFIDIILRNVNRDKFKVFASSYRNESNIENPGFEDTDIKYFSLNIGHGWLDLFKGAWRLSRIIKAESIKLVHSHHYYESIIAQMACVLAGNCKHVIGRHYHDQFYLTTSGFKLWFYLTVEAIINGLSSKIIVPSTAIVNLLCEQGVKSQKIIMIPYAFDFTADRYNNISNHEIIELKKKLGWTNHFLIGNISRHHIIKGQTYLIKALKNIKSEIPNCKLVFIGDGPLHEDLAREVADRGLTGEVQFLGWRKDSHKLLNCLDIVVHPTLQEAFPQIMIETMALGKPIIITPVSGATDVIEDGVNGILIEPQNPDSIVDAVMNLYSNKQKLSAIGMNAQAFVRAHYSKDKIIPKFEKLYFDLISKTKL